MRIITIVFDKVRGIDPHCVVLVSIIVEQHIFHGHELGIDGDAGVGHGSIASAKAVEVADEEDGVVEKTRAYAEVGSKFFDGHGYRCLSVAAHYGRQ